MGEWARAAVAVIEASYRLGDSIERWLQELLDAFCAAIGAEPRGVAALYDATRDAGVDVDHVVARGLPPDLVDQLFHPPISSPGKAEQLVGMFRRGVFGAASQLIWPLVPGYRQLFQRFQIDDLTAVITSDPSFRGCLLAAPTPRRRYSPRTRYLWRKLSAHIAAGLRLRRLLAPLLEAHADAGNLPRNPGEALRAALVRIDGSRAMRGSDAEQAIDLWGGLVAGRWSLVQHFQRDGRRYFLAYRNDPAVAKVRALTPRELMVWSYAATGRTNRLIAHTLGLSVPTVARHLGRARRKMGGEVTLATLRALLPGA